MSHHGVSIEEIAHLVGHASTRTTEVVYRRELSPVITTGAEIMDEVFRVGNLAGRGAAPRMAVSATSSCEQDPACLGHPCRGKLNHTPSERILGQRVQVVEVRDTVCRHPIVVRREFQFGNQAADGARERSHDNSADPFRYRVASQDEHGPVAAGCRSEPDLTSPHEPSLSSPRPGPSRRSRTTRVPHRPEVAVARSGRRCRSRDGSAGGGRRRAAARSDRHRGGQPIPAPGVPLPHRPGNSASSYIYDIAYDMNGQSQRRLPGLPLCPDTRRSKAEVLARDPQIAMSSGSYAGSWRIA